MGNIDNRKNSLSSNESRFDRTIYMAGQRQWQPGTSTRVVTRCSLLMCDMCDEVFRNRHDSYKHNLQHMMVSLKRQFFHKCDGCHLVFLTSNELKRHILDKHSVEPVTVTPRFLFEDELEVDDTKPDIEMLSRIIEDIKKLSDDPNDAVHFDDLMVPGEFKCRRCVKVFDTKYQLIQHEPVHMKARKPRPLLCEYCDHFIAGNYHNLNRHVANNHSYGKARKKQYKHCRKCGLRYSNYYKHINLYHRLVYCQLCKQGFEEESAMLKHKEEHLAETKCSYCELVSTAIEIQEHEKTHTLNYSSTIRVCDICCVFLKNRQNLQYVHVQNLRGVGTRLHCERCGHQFFELKVVKRTQQKKKMLCGRGEKKQRTNSDRLKNIQQRLKKIKSLR